MKPHKKFYEKLFEKAKIIPSKEILFIGDNMLSFTKDFLRVIDFKNIIYMDDKKLNIMFKNYIIKIQGSNLEISVYGYKEIIVKGIINNIEFS